MSFWRRLRRRVRKPRPGHGSTTVSTAPSLADLRKLANQWEPSADILAAARDHDPKIDMPAFEWALLALWILRTEGPLASRGVVNTAVRIHGRVRELELARLAAWRSEPAWQLIEILRDETPEMRGDLDWQETYARTASTVGSYEEADAAFRRAQSVSDDPSKLAFQRGAMWHRHDTAKAQAAFDEAIQLDAYSPSPVDAARFGIGAFYQRFGDVDRAIDEYERFRATCPGDARLELRIAKAHHRRFDWAASADAAQRALDMEPLLPQAHFALGLALERQERWIEAADAYAKAAKLEYPKKRRVVYRRGFCLAAAGATRDAVEAFDVLRMPSPTKLARVSDDQSKHFTLTTDLLSCWHRGHDAYARTDWSAAHTAFAFVARRSDHFHADIWIAYGKAAARAGQLEEALEAFLEVQVFRQPEYLRVPKWEDEPIRRRNSTYAEFWTRNPVDSNLVLWESDQGASVSCNPLALFYDVVDRAEFSGYTHVWAVDKRSRRVPADFASRSNVIVTERNSHLYLRTLATAGKLITNATLPPYFVRRHEQKYLNTWHGTPLKTLGINVAPLGQLSHANVSRNLMQATHLAMPNAHTRDVLLDGNQVSGLAGAAVTITGSPRLDVMLRDPKRLRAETCDALGLDETKAVIFYAPTWRPADETTGSIDVVYEAVRELSKLNGASILVKLHHMDANRDRTWPDGVTIVPDEFDTYSVLGACDVLVTDYSSLMFDFLPLRRPLVLFTPDLEHYAATRGFVMDIDDVPAARATTANALREAVLGAMAEPRIELNSLAESLIETEDGHAADRVRRFFFEDEVPSRHAERIDPERTVLFQAAMLPNGITSSLLNLLASLDDTDVQAILLLDQHRVRSDPNRHPSLDRVPKSVRILAVPNGSVRTLEEAWVHARFARMHSLSTEAQWDVYWSATRREARRIVGDFVAGAAIEFDGYAPNRAALARFLGRRHVIYQHSTMLAEFRTRSPRLASQFELCRVSRPQIVSVSRPILEQNASDLAAAFDVPTDLYRLVPNQIDADRILAQAKEPLEDDLSDWFGDDIDTFVSIGRLSIEKNHELLIDAFSQVCNLEPRARLVIIGSGFLESTLKGHVSRLGLGDRIYFAGHRDNPFPALAKAKALIISSFHEGQPMVVLEALVLGTGVLSTDLPGVRDMTPDGAGVFVAPEPASMADGMKRVLNHDLEVTFDPIAYQQEAREAFLRVAAGTAEPAIKR